MSGLGPRKAQRLIQRLKKGNSSIICTREEILQEHILTTRVYENVVGFLKVSIPQDKRRDVSEMKLLDQTRIHPLDYGKLERIAVYIHGSNQKYENLDSHNRAEAVKKLYMDHEKLKDTRSSIEENQVLYGKQPRNLAE